jgi:hypothetical protein
MSTATDYIPRKNLEFFNWQDNFMTKVAANLLPWAISNPDFVIVQALQTPYVPAFNKIKNKQSATQNDHVAHDSLKADYEAGIRVFVKQWITGNTKITDSQANELGVPKRDTILTPRPKINTSPFTKGTSEDGANILYVCRVDADSTRSSRHADADGVELVYIVGTTPPANPAGCNKSVISTKSRFYVQHDIADTGKKVFGYLRWKNVSDSSKSGPWSTLLTTTITE